MATSTAAEVRTTIASLASDILKLAATRTAAAHTDSTAVLGQLIRETDDAIARVHGHLDDPEIAELATIVRAQRHLLYLLMVDVNSDQAWFWTESWQAGEREVDAGIAAGRTTFYASEQELEAAFAAVDAELDTHADL
jgi:hypothetical protein